MAASKSKYYPEHLTHCCHIAPNLVTQISKLLEAWSTDVIKLLSNKTEVIALNDIALWTWTEAPASPPAPPELSSLTATASSLATRPASCSTPAMSARNQTTAALGLELERGLRRKWWEGPPQGTPSARMTHAWCILAKTDPHSSSLSSHPTTPSLFYPLHLFLPCVLADNSTLPLLSMRRRGRKARTQRITPRQLLRCRLP